MTARWLAVTAALGALAVGGALADGGEAPVESGWTSYAPRAGAPPPDLAARGRTGHGGYFVVTLVVGPPGAIPARPDVITPDPASTHPEIQIIR